MDTILKVYSKYLIRHFRSLYAGKKIVLTKRAHARQ